jgi:hypothetical protein
LAGSAVDFHVVAMSDIEAAHHAARSGLFGGIGYYPQGSPLGAHAHVDIRLGNVTARWRHARDAGRWVYRPWYDRDNVLKPEPAFRSLGGRKDGCDLQKGD